MAEAFYRLKSAGGAWTRVTGTTPITVTGLTEGATYEYLKGDGTIGEVTAGATATAIPPTFNTQPSISGTVSPGETVTLNEGTFSGTTPITATLTLDLDGADVTADVTSNSYTIPAGTDGQSIVLTVDLSNSVGTAQASVTETVTGTLTLPKFQSSQVFTPDPTRAFVIASDAPNTGEAQGESAYPHIVDVTSDTTFNGVTNSAGERLRWLLYTSTDHDTGGIRLYCGFGSFITGTWKTYAQALADGDLSSYAGTTPTITNDIFYEIGVQFETPFVWNHGGTWYLAGHGKSNGSNPPLQSTVYATSSSPFGPWTNQGNPLNSDAESDHQGYARFFEIPAEASVEGPIASGAAGQFIVYHMNTSTLEGHYGIHVINKDMTGAEMLTAVPYWYQEDVAYPAGHPSAGDFPPVFPRYSAPTWIGGEFAVLMETSNAGGMLMETATGADMHTITRKPKPILKENEFDIINNIGAVVGPADSYMYPSIVEDGGQKYLVLQVTTRPGTNVYHSTVAMPVTINTTAQPVEPRVYDDHFFEAFDTSGYATTADLPASWTLQDSSLGSNVSADVSGGRIRLWDDTGLAHTGFDPAQTDWAEGWFDMSYSNQTLERDQRGSHYMSSNKSFAGDPGLASRSGVADYYQDASTGQTTLQPPNGDIYTWPGGWHWDIANARAYILRANKTHDSIYDLTTSQNDAMKAQTMFPGIHREATGIDKISVGKGYVRYKGAAHTPNAAPAVSSAATDASGSKVTVTLDRECLGRFGFVVVVGSTVVNTTPNRVDATTIDLVRDTGTFGATDDVRLYYVTGGDVRSDPQWVLLPEITDSAVANNVA